MDFNGVAVDDGGDADDLISFGEYRRCHQQHKKKYRAANAFPAHVFSSRPSAETEQVDRRERALQDRQAWHSKRLLSSISDPVP